MGPHERLIAILKERSVRWGDFTLASGKTSDLYIDARQTTLNAEGASLIGQLILDALLPEVQGVGGPVTGADPIAGSVAALSWRAGRPIHGFMVRKEPKKHGLQQWVEGRGSLPDGSSVCIVEDTVTTGGSLLLAIQRAEAEGLRVVQCIAIVDREEGAVERLAKAGYVLQPLVTRADLL